MTEIKLVPSRLYATADKKVEEQVKKDLEVEDPALKDAIAAIEENETDVSP
jgi:hypothetical protein